MRKTKEELQSLMIQYDVSNIWSWSKYNSYLTDPYGYLLKYILKVPEDKVGNAFSFLGGFTHSVLEDFYDGNIDNDQMVDLFENKIFEQKIMDIRFDTDDGRNDNIREKYVTCIKHFFKNYQKDEKAILEKFVHIKIGEHLFQGYIDKLHVEDKILYVDDFKTSTIYKGEKINKEKGQLLLYSISLAENNNIPYENIKARWNFLKYVNVECEQANGKIAIMSIERNDILNGLRAKLKMWFTKFKYSESDFEKYFLEAQELNQNKFIDQLCLCKMPKEIQDKFKITDCLVEIEINKTEVESFKEQIKNNCDEILKKELEYSIKKDDKIFWIDIDKSNSYFFLNLSGYSPKLHAPLKKYLDEYEEMDKALSINGEKNNKDVEFLKSLLL